MRNTLVEKLTDSLVAAGGVYVVKLVTYCESLRRLRNQREGVSMM